MTLTSMQQQYQQYRLQLLAVEKFKKQQQSLTDQINHAKQDTDTYEQQLAAERKKLNKMEQFSFVNTFRTWTGKQQELIEQHYHEIAATELKLVEAQLMAEDLNDDLIDIIYKINAINAPYTEQQIQLLERQIEQVIQEQHPQLAGVLQENLHQHTLVEQLLIEIEEALVAGDDAEKVLIEAADALKDANMYSTWDTFLGGGLIATAAKHKKLDLSKSYIHEAQLALQRFQNELLDIQQMKADSLLIETDGLVKFADYFLDDVFSAWSIHSKIATSMTQISHVLDDVRNTCRAVQQKKLIAEEKKQYLLDERVKILGNTEQIL